MSVLHFGENAFFSGPGTVSTPLVLQQEKDFYYVSLEAISVLEERIEFSTGVNFYSILVAFIIVQSTKNIVEGFSKPSLTKFSEKSVFCFIEILVQLIFITFTYFN